MSRIDSISKLKDISKDKIIVKYKKSPRLFVDDVILSLLYISSIKGKTLFQKQIFLATEEVFKSKSVDLGYTPHLYGPYSRLVEDTVYFLQREGLIFVMKRKGEGSIYQITEKGKEHFKLKMERIKVILNSLRKHKSSWDEFTSSGISNFVYRNYPAFTVNSKLGDKKWSY